MEFDTLSLIKKINIKVPIESILKLTQTHVNKAGFCKCPAHKDKHPSLKIYGNKGIKVSWLCFQCGAKGKAVEFFSIFYSLSLEKSAIILAKKFLVDTKSIDVPQQTKYTNFESVFNGWCRSLSSTVVPQIFSIEDKELKYRIYNGWYNFGEELICAAREVFMVSGDFTVLDSTKQRIVSYLQFIKETYETRL